MAIVKHSTSKNARYSDVLEYYSYKNKESSKTGHYEPILDEWGLMIERQNYAVIYIAAAGEEDEPENWSTACMRTNIIYKKNQRKSDRKSHEYIISHPSEDREKMSMEDLVAEGKAFATKYLAGYDVLLAVHRDTDNDHVHISINSVRAGQRESCQDWMMRDKEGNIVPCELMAGGKHIDSPKLRRDMNEWLRQYSKAHGYTVKDNNAIADEHREARHGKKNERMRQALLAAASRSANLEDLQRIMRTDHRMYLKVSGSGKTISVLYPGNQKYVRLRTLGLETEDLTERFGSSEYLPEKTATRSKVTMVTEEKPLVREGYYSYRMYVNSRTKRPYRTSLYDENGRRRSNIELLFMLAVTVLRSESGLWDKDPTRDDEGPYEIYYHRDWKVQNMLDSIRIAREEGIVTEKQIEERIQEIGIEYGQLRSVLDATIIVGDHEQVCVLEAQLEDVKKRYRNLKRLDYNTKLAANAQYCYGPLYREGYTRNAEIGGALDER